MHNALTIDVEEHFQVAAFKDAVDVGDWSNYSSRVEANTQKLIAIFDEKNVKATFFVLGWVAEKYPGLVREIVASGHELACHGYSHQLIYEQEPDLFRSETDRAKKALEDVSGEAVIGYRAASYSITLKSLWALDIIAEAGFTYDSSIVPARHDIYGIANANVFPHTIRLANGGTLDEFPPATQQVLGQRFPVGGGGYFRILPYAITRRLLSKINKDSGQPFSFYLHPWEIDVDQPRISAGWKSRFRHYRNLDKCEGRLRRLLGEFSFTTMHDVMSEMNLATVDVASYKRPAQLNPA